MEFGCKNTTFYLKRCVIEGKICLILGKSVVLFGETPIKARQTIRVIVNYFQNAFISVSLW